MSIGVADIPRHEIELSAMHSSGPGGQNVNKVSSAVHLRFDVRASSLPGWLQERLLRLRDHRVVAGRWVVIKAQRYRSQLQNRQDALLRLDDLLQQAQRVRKARRPTAPGAAVKRRRLEEKNRRGRDKRLRQPPDY